MPRPLPLRGVIEGFYGPPWTHAARLAALDFMADSGLNAYVYAPKDDTKHRGAWREPYDGEERSRFAELVARASRRGVRFGFAVSPGLDIDYTSPADRAALIAKVGPLMDTDVEWIVLALDDIPVREGLGAQQADLAAWLLAELTDRRPGARLDLVPTEYVGVHPTEYLDQLAAGLPADVAVMWTGTTVCAPTITAAEAAAWRRAVRDHPVVVWDNYPVNDGPMAHALHLGPYRGREADVTDHVDGILVNPMTQAWASRVALATFAEWAVDPAGYDATAAWGRAIELVGGPRATALRALAEACADGPLSAPEDVLAHRLVDAVAQDPAALDSLLAHLDAVRAAPLAFAGPGGDPLARELGPWLDQARLEAETGRAAVKLLRAVKAGRDAEQLMQLAFLVLFSWAGTRNASAKVAFGPRFAVYPAVVQLADGTAGLDVSLALTEDRCATDRICRLALEEYRRWTTTR